MLDANLRQQLQTYLERLTQPVELVASLDESDASTEMRGLLEDKFLKLLVSRLTGETFDDVETDDRLLESAAQ